VELLDIVFVVGMLTVWLGTTAIVVVCWPKKKVARYAPSRVARDMAAAPPRIIFHEDSEAHK